MQTEHKRKSHHRFKRADDQGLQDIQVNRLDDSAVCGDSPRTLPCDGGQISCCLDGPLGGV
jgi:hypothetical protein